MARRNNVEANVTITFNGEQAKQVVDDLKKKAEQLRAKIAEMQKAANPDTKGISKLQKELNATDKAIKSATTDTKKYEETLKNLNSASIKELTAAQRALLAQIKKLAPGSDEFVAATQKYKQVTARIKSVETAYKQVDESQQSMFRRLASGMNRYFLMASTAIATVTGLSMRFRDAARQAAELDDKMAQVMKTTGLTHEQVEQLNEAFKKMDTRTTIEQLNLLAYQAGKLGRNTVESVQQFVEAADIINVALGDVLGDNATLEIAKLAEVYSQSTDLIESKDLKGKMMAVGSAINQLGKESTASESYMVDFLGRLGGVATQAGLSADQILGYASALDQMKQKVEMSATAFQKLIQQMIKKPEEFVKAAQMPLEDFKNLMDTDMNAAIQRVLTGFNEMGGFTELVPIFKDMGLDGARAASVIASLAGNLDKVSIAQATATEHIEKGTSMLNEYNIMNSSLQARLEKARKEFHNATIELGQNLNPVLLKSTNAITYIIKILAHHSREVLASVAAITALTIAIKLHNAQVTLSTVLHATWTTSVNVLKAAFFLLTGQITKATAAMAAMNAVSKMSIFGLVFAAITSIVFAVSRWIKSTKEAIKEVEHLSRASKELNDVETKVNEKLKEERENVYTLTGIINNNSISIDKRREAIKKLQSIIPEYHASLTDEGLLINNNTSAIKDYLKKLEDRIRLEELVAKRASLQSQLDELKDARDDAEAALQAELDSASFGEDMKIKARFDLKYNKPINDVVKSMDEVDKAIKKITDSWTEQDFVPIKTFEDALAALEKEQAEIENQIKQDYINRKISQEEYQEAMRDANLEFLKKKLDLTRQYGEDETKVMAAWLDAQVEANKLADKEIEDARKKAEQEAKKAEEEALREKQRRLNELTRLADRFKKELLEPIDAYKEELDKLNEVRAEGLIDEDLYQQALINLKKKYAKKAADKVGEEEGLTLFRKYELEKEALRQFWIDGKTGWEDYEKAVAKLRIEYARQTSEQISHLLGEIGNSISSMRDFEMAQAEAQYQQDLTNAGDNADERAKIEEEYEKKQLEIKKKYADVDMAITMAKTIASGAAAAIRAYEEGGPYLGPALAAMIAVTTAMEVATIAAQRNAIKNASVGASNGSGNGNQNYGDRVINGGYKQGGYTTRSSSDDVAVDVVHANEYVAPAWLLRKEPVFFRNLEEYRKTGIRPHSFTNGNGFKEGGYSGSPTTQQIISSDPATAAQLARLSDAIDNLVENGVQSFVVYKQFQEFQKQRNRFKKITSLKHETDN